MDTKTVLAITLLLMLGCFSLILHQMEQQTIATSQKVDQLDKITICLEADVMNDPELKVLCEEGNE